MRKSIERKRRATSITASHLQRRRIARRHIVGRITIISLVIVGCIIGWLQLSTSAKDSVSTTLTTTNDKQTKERLGVIIETTQKAEQAALNQLSHAAKTGNQPPVQQIAAPSAPSSAVCDVTDPTSLTVVVNKKHCISPPSWAPADLVSVNGYLMRAEAASHMQAMMNAADAAGLGFSISSAYRSYNDQVATYNYWAQVDGSTTSADTVSARPGYSEHQTGFAADLKVGNCVLDCFGSTSQYTWLKANAADYGFIERYPPNLTSITGYSPEPWHWRYIGIPTATAMKQSGIETLETYFGVSGGNYN